MVGLMARLAKKAEEDRLKAEAEAVKAAEEEVKAAEEVKTAEEPAKVEKASEPKSGSDKSGYHTRAAQAKKTE